MFGIGGLTGLPLGLDAADIHLHDTYYVIGHFHYVVAPGTIFALFAGIYYWFPKATGRMMNETLGKLHFWPLVRLHERHLHADVHPWGWPASRGGCTTAERATPSRSQCCTWNVVSMLAAWVLAAGPDPLHHQLLLEHLEGAEGRRQPLAGDHAGVGGALAAAARQLRRCRRRRTAAPTSTACPARPRTSRRSTGPKGSLMAQRSWKFPTPSRYGRDTGLNNGKIGIWLFLASEVMLFGALFATYIMLRVGAADLAARRHDPERAARHAQHRRADHLVGHHGDGLGVADAQPTSASTACTWAPPSLLGFVFLVVKYFEYSAKFHHGLLSRHQHLPGHLLHAHRPARAARDRRDGGERVLLGPRRQALEDEPEHFTNRVEHSGLFWHFVDLVWIFLFPVLYLL